MKKILILLFIFVCIFSINKNVSAAIILNSNNLGSTYNPLQIQIQQDPWAQMRQQQQQGLQQAESLRNSLKSIYGTNAYYACSSTSSCTKNDLSLPGAAKSCELQIQSCLENKNATQQNIFTQGKNPFNKTAIKCDANYQLNTATDTCEPIPKTNDQICSDAYANSKWYGKYGEDKIVLECDCKSGYTWNTERTSCNAITPIKTTKVASPVSNKTIIAPIATQITSTETPIIPQQKVGWFRRFINWLK